MPDDPLLDGVPAEWLGDSSGKTFTKAKQDNSKRDRPKSAKLLPPLKGSAKARSAKNLKNAGDSSTVQICTVDNDDGRSNVKAAELMNVSPRSVATAAKVIKEAPPETAAAVASGQKTLHEAAATLKKNAELRATPATIRDEADGIVPDKLLETFSSRDRFPHAATDVEVAP